MHALAIAVVLLNLLTGLRIAIVHRPNLLWLSELLPQGELHSLHVWGGYGLTAVAISYLVYRSVVAPAGVSSRVSVMDRYHRCVIRAGYLLLTAMLLSGWLLLFDGLSFAGVTADIATFHFYSALAVAAYLVLHGGAYFVQLGARLFTRMFYPGRRIARVNMALLGLAAVSMAVVWQLRMASHAIELPIARIPLDQFIHIDGIANEPAWQQARTIHINTHGGANFDNGETRVLLRAVHNGVEAFFHVTWDDPDESLKHLPLKKTDAGWTVLGEGFYRFDEQQYYEDKFAVMLANTCSDGAAGTMHLGRKPLDEKPANWHGKGYHYASDGQVRDLWHWKAVRTNNMVLADDNFIGPPDRMRPGERRYTAGYMKYSKESGAYVMNWQWYTPSTVTPKRLPKDPQVLLPYQQKEEESAGNLSWVIPWFDYQPYQSQHDHYPAGTVMPSVMYRSNRFEGDRADVRAHAQWRDGKWSLELVRKLDTGSDLDVAITTGVCLWVAAFDRSQIAHTRHQRPLRVTLEASND